MAEVVESGVKSSVNSCEEVRRTINSVLLGSEEVDVITRGSLLQAEESVVSIVSAFEALSRAVT